MFDLWRFGLDVQEVMTSRVLRMMAGELSERKPCSGWGLAFMIASTSAMAAGPIEAALPLAAPDLKYRFHRPPPERAYTFSTALKMPPIPANIPRLVWNGDVPHQKWMNFYTKVLSKFAATAGLKLTLRVEVAPAEGVSPQKVDETKVSLRELGLKDTLEGE
jgi:hypothetical protein